MNVVRASKALFFIIKEALLQNEVASINGYFEGF
jgi:hypothetical protein